MTTASEQPVKHPVFARMWARIARREDPEATEHRRRALEHLSGTVVEVGCGTGVNFALYPPAVERVIALEPEPYLRELAAGAAREARVDVRVVEGVAGAMPLESESLDAALCSLVLCSVPDQRRALAEIRRVLRPGGELRFYEHVVSHHPVVARVQRFADATFWPHIAGGCHASRDTAGEIASAGFAVERCERFAYAPAPVLPAVPHLLGIARRP